MKRVLTMMNEYAYNFLFPLNPVGSSVTVMSSSTGDRHDGFDSSYDALINLRKSELCAYKSILRSDDSSFGSCDYFQSGGSRGGVQHEVQAGTGPIYCDSATLEEASMELRSTTTEPGFVVALSLFLTQIATSNSSSASCNVGVLTPFHSVCIPPIPIRAYLIRLAQNFGCSNECFVLAIIYVGRMVKYNRNFTITLLNVHRVIVTALILATKFFDDIYYSNAFYAKVSGVDTREINSLEIHFLRMIRFQLFVTEREYEIYRQCITKSATMHPAVPSMPVAIFSKQPPDESGGDVQSKDASFAGERKRLPLLGSSPYNYDCYPGVYGKKLENRDMMKPLLAGGGESSASSQHGFARNLLAQQLNGRGGGGGPGADASSKQHETKIDSLTAPEKWIPQFSLDASQTRKEQDRAGQPRGLLAKEDPLFLQTGANPPAPSSKIKGGNRNDGHGSFSAASSDGCDKRLLLDCSRFARSAGSRSSDGLKPEGWSHASTQLRPRAEPEDARMLLNAHPDHGHTTGTGSNATCNNIYTGGDNIIGLYGSLSAACDYNVLSGTDALTSSAVTTLVANPSLSHYGQHMLINSSNIRCTTGVDRRLFV